MCELWLQYCMFGESSVSALVPAGLSSRGGVLYLRGETHIIFLLPTALKLADPSQLVHALGWVVAPCTWIKRTFLVLYHLTDIIDAVFQGGCMMDESSAALSSGKSTSKRLETLYYTFLRSLNVC